MRQFPFSERGSANWPFIITLILLLAFGYLWFDERDKRETAETDSAKATVKEKAARDAAQRFLEYADTLSAKVGYNDYEARLLIPEPTTPGGTTDQDKVEQEAKTLGNSLAGSKALTDLTKLDTQLSRDGTLDGQPGLLNYLINNTGVEIVSAIRSPGGDDVPETAAVFEWMTEEFKAKLREVNALAQNIPVSPKPVADPDDEAEVARHAQEMKAYEEAVQAFQDAIDQLQGMEGFEKWDSIIKPPKGFADDTQGVVRLEFFDQAPTTAVTVETLVGYPKQIFPPLFEEMKRNKESDAGVIEQVRGDAATKQGELDQTQADLAAAQERANQELAQITGELSVANETAESNRLEATNALQRVQVVEEEMRRTIATFESQVAALQNRVRLDKEKRDLKIRRDAPDGRILSAGSMGTAILNLGSSDKVYPGLLFNVSTTGRGGGRLPKGQVEVTKVLGPHSARAAIVSQIPGNPIAENDIIHNPLWSTTDVIHIWLAGDLERYPIEIARARLAKMGVIIDKQISGDTDYVVVPNSMAAPAPAASDEDDEDEEGPVGQSDYEKIQNVARNFGATVITEKMLNAFLGY